jgi:hypothetical protein
MVEDNNTFKCFKLIKNMDKMPCYAVGVKYKETTGEVSRHLNPLAKRHQCSEYSNTQIFPNKYGIVSTFVSNKHDLDDIQKKNGLRLLEDALDIAGVELAIMKRVRI